MLARTEDFASTEICPEDVCKLDGFIIEICRTLSDDLLGFELLSRLEKFAFGGQAGRSAAMGKTYGSADIAIVWGGSLCVDGYSVRGLELHIKNSCATLSVCVAMVAAHLAGEGI